MPTPTIPAGNLFMNATLYTGTGAAQSITNGNPGQSFQPDLVWVKARSNAYNNVLNDSVRGSTKLLISNGTDAEQTELQSITSFNSNGFSLGTSGTWNQSGSTFVGWQWKAGGTAVSNTSGTITSSVSANTTSGFSVVKYTTPASGTFTVGHGLGVAPSFIINKIYNIANNWYCYHVSLGNNTEIVLNTTAAAASAGGDWNSTTPTATVFSMGSGWTGSYSMISYCWAPIAGYSVFGSYTGNGSADGTFVYTGFRPKYVLIKRSSGVGDWLLQDTSRSPYNVADSILYPNYVDAEGTGGGYGIDILSNGFKFRNSATYANSSGSTYVYACWAENPFKYANAR